MAMTQAEWALARAASAPSAPSAASAGNGGVPDGHPSALGDHEIEVRVNARAFGGESAGTVAELGPAVTAHGVGDRVAVELGVPCGGCPACRDGDVRRCLELDVPASSTPADDAPRTIVVHEAFAFPLPDSVASEHAALVAPLAIAVAACRTAEVGSRSHVLITGGSLIGLLALQAARAFGAARVSVTDSDPRRLRWASELGADDIFDATALSGDVAIDPDVHLECSGDARSARAGISWLAPRGTALLVAAGGERLDVPLSWIREKELVIRGVPRWADSFPVAIELLASGAVRIDRAPAGSDPLGTRR